jgi:hypothetical protein
MPVDPLPLALDLLPDDGAQIEPRPHRNLDRVFHPLPVACLEELALEKGCIDARFDDARSPQLTAQGTDGLT